MMPRSLKVLALSLTALLSAPFSQAEEAEIDPSPFEASAQAFLDAFALRDAASIGELFTEDAIFADEFGERTISRDAIVEMFEGVFQASPDCSIDEIRMTGLRQITDDVIVEEGETDSTLYEGGDPKTSRYVALHVKDGDSWKIDLFRSAGEQTRERVAELSRLSWLVGEWVSEQSDAVVNTSCKWSDDGNYLLRRFDVKTAEGRELNGVQRIGWDPREKQIRSWTFDSRGGFFEGRWIHQGVAWIVTQEGVTAEGDRASSSAIFRVIDSQMFDWAYTQMIVGTDVRVDGPRIVMVRKPPQVGKADPPSAPTGQ